MKLNKYLSIGMVSLVTVSCGGGGSSSGSSPAPTPTNANVMNITINRTSLCGQNVNIPCVSLTVCNPSSGACQIVDNVILDTGSTGLRLFKSALGNAALTPIESGSNQLAECITFGDGSQLWGPIAMANIVLGGENANTIAIEQVDASFANSAASTCPNAAATPSSFGANGILGVSPTIFDCPDGVNCTAPQYYHCNGNTCTAVDSTTISTRVINPITALTTDNNGFIINFPGISANGATNVTGTLILGIGTESNNAPGAGVTVFPFTNVNAPFQFNTNFINGSVIGLFDSGSNFLTFPNNTSPSIPTCNGVLYCPTIEQNLSATNVAFSSSPSSLANFSIGNAVALIGNGNAAYSNIGAQASGSFIWGMPFFFGRTIYFGMENQTAPLYGKGPYAAY